MGTLMRTAIVSSLLGLAVLASAGCEQPGQAESDKILQAWRRAGLTPTVFTPLDSKELAPGTCRQGQVDGLTTTLCNYADAGAARAAQAPGLAHVGEATGLSISAGQLLLVVVDSDGKDPNGRTVNKIATLFRDAQVPPPTEKADNGDGEGSANDTSDAGSS